MSFCVDLWNEYEIIYNHFCDRRKGLKDLIFILTSKYDTDLEYSKSLKRIYEFNYIITSEGTLSHGIQAFKNDIQNQFNYIVDFLNSLREDIIEPLKKFYNDQLNIGKKINDERRKVEKDFKESVDRLDKYHTCSKISEESKLQYEIARQNKLINNDQKSKHSNKAQNTLKEAKEAEKAYILSLNYANNTRDLFIDTNKRILTDFQILEEKYVDFIKDSLRKYTIYQIAYVRNLQYDLEKKAKTMESIDAHADIREFIEKNSTRGGLPYKFEFIPYTSEVFLKNNDNSIPTSIITNVKNFIQNTFISLSSEIESDPVEARANAEIKSLVSFSWEGKPINEEERKIFFKHVKEKKYRKFFLFCLNKFRTSGQFNLDEKSFDCIGNLLMDSLESIYKDRDFESSISIMMLSQTFYKTATEPNKPRIFIQISILSHRMWKDLEFWEELIRYSINEEMFMQQNYNIYTFENPLEKKKRIGNLVNSELVSLIYNMISFEISKPRVMEIIKKFTDYYQLNEENLISILKNIDSYNNNEIISPKADNDNSITIEQNKNINLINNKLDKSVTSQIENTNELKEKLAQGINQIIIDEIKLENKIEELTDCEATTSNIKDLTAINNSESSLKTNVSIARAVVGIEINEKNEK